MYLLRELLTAALVLFAERFTILNLNRQKLQVIVTMMVLLFLLVALWRLFKTPLKLALRLAVNTVLGFGAVWALNLTTAYTGLSLGLNLFNALVTAVLGLPGFCLLLLVKWVLGT